MKVHPLGELNFNSRNKRARRKLNTTVVLNRLYGKHSVRPCHYCGMRVRREDATFDHLVPLCRGGYDKASNGVIACQSCNQAKGQMTAEEFLQAGGGVRPYQQARRGILRDGGEG